MIDRSSGVGRGVVAAAAAMVIALAPAPLALAQQVERDLSEAGTWSIVAEPELNTPAGELHLARQALAQQRYGDARRRMDTWLKKHKGDPLEPEAYLVRGDSLLLQKEYYKSLYDYEYVCRMFPGSEAFMIALEREFEVAQLFASGVRRKLWGVRWMRAYEEAEELFIRIQERAPGSKLAERAARALADHYYARRKMELAATMYDIYLKNHPNAGDSAEAMQRLVFSHLATFKGPAFDVSGLEEANGWLNILRARFPAQAQQMRAEALQRRIEEARAEKMLVDADFYLRRKDEVSAKFMLERLIRRHSSTLAAQRAYEAMKERGWVGEEVPEELRDQPAPEILGPAPEGNPDSAAPDPGPAKENQP
ncbi:MAG: outer membrane protein assembly factor BamD [Phycisphaerales bacterium]|nr:outer membrane protein assembly factor BamD [Phycisphaerales bacterium]